jgi:hypothetical protein
MVGTLDHLEQALTVYQLSHLCGEFKVEVCGQQTIAFIGPRQGDLVELLSNLSSECPQRVKLLLTIREE